MILVEFIKMSFSIKYLNQDVYIYKFLLFRKLPKKMYLRLSPITYMYCNVNIVPRVYVYVFV